MKEMGKEIKTFMTAVKVTTNRVLKRQKLVFHSQKYIPKILRLLNVLNQDVNKNSFQRNVS
jgi:hypothetical protein